MVLSPFSHGKIVSALQYFTDNVQDYWHILYECDSMYVFSDRICQLRYFYDISAKAIKYKGKFNEKGIYLFKGYDGRWYLHALEIAQFALASWVAGVKTGMSIWFRKALIHCNWLVENQDSDGGWRMEHRNPAYSSLSVPWPSALAQGFAISSLLRAYCVTLKKSYLISACRGCDFLEKKVENGGVKRFFGTAFIYEEYPCFELNGVLNGYITCVLSIYELAKVVSGRYKKMLYDNLENLLKILPMYDLGFWTKYSLDGNIASGYYHRLVVLQLKVLSRIDHRFYLYYNKFKNYLTKRNALKAFLLKVSNKLK